jgi:hypothetical protein
MACVQVDFVQALLPEFPKKSTSCIISTKLKQMLYCHSGNLFYFVSYLYRGHNQRPLVPKKVPIKM